MCFQFKAGHRLDQHNCGCCAGGKRMQDLEETYTTTPACGAHTHGVSGDNFQSDAEPASLPNRYLGVRPAGNGQYISQVSIFMIGTLC